MGRFVRLKFFSRVYTHIHNQKLSPTLRSEFFSPSFHTCERYRDMETPLSDGDGPWWREEKWGIFVSWYWPWDSVGRGGGRLGEVCPRAQIGVRTAKYMWVWLSVCVCVCVCVCVIVCVCTGFHFRFLPSFFFFSFLPSSSPVFTFGWSLMRGPGVGKRPGSDSEPETESVRVCVCVCACAWHLGVWVCVSVWEEEPFLRPGIYRILSLIRQDKDSPVPTVPIKINSIQLAADPLGTGDKQFPLSLSLSHTHTHTYTHVNKRDRQTYWSTIVIIHFVSEYIWHAWKNEMKNESIDGETGLERE